MHKLSKKISHFQNKFWFLLLLSLSNEKFCSNPEKNVNSDSDCVGLKQLCVFSTQNKFNVKNYWINSLRGEIKQMKKGKLKKS